MLRLPWRVAWLVLAIVALGFGGALTEKARTSNAVSFPLTAHPRVTNRCPVGALPLRRADLPALRRLGLELGLHGVQKAGSQSIDYRDAHAKAHSTFYSGFVRTACPRRLVQRVTARTADVLVRYPRVNWSASLSFSIFLISRTPRGLVGWAQIH